MDSLQPFDFVSAADSESVGMVLTLGSAVFDAGIDGPTTNVLVAWISGDCTWEEPGDLTKLDSLANMTAKGMVAMWEHGAESGSKTAMRQIDARARELFQGGIQRREEDSDRAGR